MPYKEPKQGVYRILNILNGKMYIGSSCNLYSRRSHHFSLLKKGDHPNRKLQEAINSFGINNFIFEILECVEEQKNLKVREQFFIDFFDSSNQGYNIFKNSEGALGHKYGEDVRKWVSKRQMGSGNFFWGKKLSDNHKAKIGASNTGKKHSQEAIDKTRRGHFKRIINLDTREEYEYIGEAAKNTGYLTMLYRTLSEESLRVAVVTTGHIKKLKGIYNELS